MQHVNNQHTIPKCYLKKFSEDGNNIFARYEIDIRDGRKKEIINSISLKSATTRDNFYTLDCKEPMGIETLGYARNVENNYPRLYNILVDPQKKHLPNMDSRSQLLMFFLSLHCRTPKQFEYFFKTVPDEFLHEINDIREDYKYVHFTKILSKLIAIHEFKVFKILKSNDNSEFITSDNPVLIINSKGELVNHLFREQFNNSNYLIIPIDPFHCCILACGKDENGVPLEEKGFYNGIVRNNVDFKHIHRINLQIIKSADEYCFGSEATIRSGLSPILWTT